MNKKQRIKREETVRDHLNLRYNLVSQRLVDKIDSRLHSAARFTSWRLFSPQNSLSAFNLYWQLKIAIDEE